MILALQTAGPTTRMWLYEAANPAQLAKPTKSLEWDSGRQLADQLLARIVGLVREAGGELPDLTGIIVFSGPGSFTSLRIGHSVANALADSLGVAVVGAAGDDWLARGLEAVASAKPGQPALPHYGGEAHITRPNR